VSLERREAIKELFKQLIESYMEIKRTIDEATKPIIKLVEEEILQLEPEERKLLEKLYTFKTSEISDPGKLKELILQYMKLEDEDVFSYIKNINRSHTGPLRTRRIRHTPSPYGHGRRDKSKQLPDHRG
jgi:hypothetical protein